MIAVLLDELPTLCVGALLVLAVIAVRDIHRGRHPDRAWSRKHRAQRAELRRIRRKAGLP